MDKNGRVYSEMCMDAVASAVIFVWPGTKENNTSQKKNGKEKSLQSPALFSAGSLNGDFVINIVTFFWGRKTVMKYGEFPLKVSPYEAWD